MARAPEIEDPGSVGKERAGVEVPKIATAAHFFQSAPAQAPRYLGFFEGGLGVGDIERISIGVRDNGSRTPKGKL